MLIKEKDFEKKADYLFDGAVSLKELNLRFGPEIRVSQYGLCCSFSCFYNGIE